MPTEPDLMEILRTSWDMGAAVLLPRVAGTELVWVATSAHTPLAPGPFGLREPSGLDQTVDWSRVQVMFLPALAVDHFGNRLGQGGGFYDRTLTNVPAARDGGPLKVGVVHEAEFLESVPVDEHDHGVDAVLTEERFVRFTPDEG
jgi:5-formyltetrahydrofolate cyclo-ligase